MSVVVCLFVMLNDPTQNNIVQQRVREWENREIREPDKPLGYERTLERQRKEKPELYEAWVDEKYEEVKSKLIE